MCHDGVLSLDSFGFHMKKTDGYDDDDLWTSMIYDDQTMMIFDDLWITTMIYDLVMILEYLWWSMIQAMIDQTLCWCHNHGSFKMNGTERLELALSTPLIRLKTRQTLWNRDLIKKRLCPTVLFRITPNALVHHSHRCRSKNLTPEGYPISATFRHTQLTFGMENHHFYQSNLNHL